MENTMINVIVIAVMLVAAAFLLIATENCFREFWNDYTSLKEVNQTTLKEQIQKSMKMNLSCSIVGTFSVIATMFIAIMIMSKIFS